MGGPRDRADGVSVLEWYIISVMNELLQILLVSFIVAPSSDPGQGRRQFVQSCGG